MKPPGDALAEAFARHRRGDLAAADRIYRKVIKAEPGNADALYLLGMLCLDEGRSEEAGRYLKRAIDAAVRAGRRVDPGWQLALGTALQRSGDAAAALGRYEAVLRDDPGSVDAMFCRATVLQDLERTAEAIDAYEAILKRVPKHAEAANNLGIVLRDSGDARRAMRAFQQAVAADPGYREAQINLGRAYADAGQPAEALPLLRRAAENNPYDAVLEEKLFASLMQLNLIDELEARAATLLAGRPDDPFLICQVGTARKARGDMDSAREQFRRALELDPAATGAHMGLAELPGEAGAESLIREAQRIVLETSISSDERIALYFALGRHYAARGEHALSLESYVKANQLRRTVSAERGYVYDRTQVTQAVNATMSSYGREMIESSRINESELPVFIVGMPRSGTTLTEQILASHPSIFGAGELPFFNRMVRELRQRFGFPDQPVPLAILSKVGAAYLEPLTRLAQGARRVTDKLPGNFKHLGLITTMFPKARIIHCRRDPMDTCLSCFMQNFGASGLVWSCDFGDAAHEYCEYRRLMDHWRAVLPPGRMLEVDYEDTVADLEAQARRVIDFVGLDWDDACLRFHEAQGTVITASQTQVRQKLYSSSVGRWRRYGDGVLPLARALAACGCGPEADGGGAAR